MSVCKREREGKRDKVGKYYELVDLCVCVYMYVYVHMYLYMSV